MTQTARLRVALVGTGYFSRFHIEGWESNPASEVVGLCDQDPEKATALGKTCGQPPVFTDIETMLDRVRPDLLDIATPPTARRAIVAAACARGIPMICQKPLAPTLAEAEEIVTMAEAAGVMLVVHENFRFMPWYREIARLLDSEHFGAIYNITFHLRPGDGRGPQAYLDRQPYFQKMDKLLVHETAVHFIDTFRYLAGEVRSVYASLRKINPVIAGEDAGLIIFEFANGAQGVFDGNRLAEHVTDNPRRTMGEMTIEGGGGRIRLDGQGRIWIKPFGENEREHTYAHGSDSTFGGGAAAALQAHVINHMRHGVPLENAGRHYLTNVVIEESVYRSHAQGCRIELSAAPTTAI